VFFAVLHAFILLYSEAVVAKLNYR